MLDGGGGSGDWASVGAVKKLLLLDVGNPLVQVLHSGRDLLQGIENLLGGPKSDRMKGNVVAMDLEGAGGSDRLQGKAERLDGGPDQDADTFVFRSVLDSRATGKHGGDLIVNFVSGLDHVDLSAIDADAREAGAQALTIADGPTAHSVWSVPHPGGEVFLSDVTGDHRAELRITVQGLVTADDMIL